MKTRALLLLLSVLYNLTLPLHAQQDAYHPFLQDGKTWVLKNITFGYRTEDGAWQSKVGDRVDYVSGDTVINDKVWKKCYSNKTDGEILSYYAALREEGEQIYAVISGDTKERLLYDFGLKPGEVLYRAERADDHFQFLLSRDDLPQSEAEWAEADYFCRPGIDDLQLLSIDTIRVNGISLRRFVFKSEWALKSPPRHINTFPYPQLVWIEGVGSEGGLVFPWSARKNQEVCCQLDGQPVFEYMDFFVPSYKPYVSEFDGDVNGDGKTDISDVVTIINVMAGTDGNGNADVKATAAAKAKSDVNGDGKTDISDITAVINIIAGKE